MSTHNTNTQWNPIINNNGVSYCKTHFPAIAGGGGGSLTILRRTPSLLETLRYHSRYPPQQTNRIRRLLSSNSSSLSKFSIICWNLIHKPDRSVKFLLLKNEFPFLLPQVQWIPFCLHFYRVFCNSWIFLLHFSKIDYEFSFVCLFVCSKASRQGNYAYAYCCSFNLSSSFNQCTLFSLFFWMFLFYISLCLGISQIVQEAQRSVGWYHDESDSGLRENKRSSSSARRFLLSQVPWDVMIFLFRCLSHIRLLST